MVRDHNSEVDESSLHLSSSAKRGVLLNGIPEMSALSVPIDMCGYGGTIPFVVMPLYSHWSLTVKTCPRAKSVNATEEIEAIITGLYLACYDMIDIAI